MTIDDVNVVSLPELVAVVVLGIGLGVVLFRRKQYRREGLLVGLLSGSLFFLLLVVSRLLLFPEHPELAALRLFTWVLYAVFILSVYVTVRLMDR